MISDCSGPVDNYSAGTTSSWLIDPTIIGNFVDYFTINSIEMDLAPGDYLRIYDGGDENAPLLGEFTGNDRFEDLLSTGTKVFVKFTCTEESETAKGFMISYVATPMQYCDPRVPILFTALEGTFTDGSPENMNYNNSTGPCTWNINPEGATHESEILIKFTRIDTEEGADLIKIYDMDKSKLIAAISGKYQPDDLPEYLLQTTKARVTFSSNAYVVGKGFEVAYTTSNIGIKESDNITNLSVYPNPAKEKLTIKFNSSFTDDFNITIFTVSGLAVFNELLHNFVGDYSKELNTSSFAQGVYVLQIKSATGIITQKIVF